MARRKPADILLPLLVLAAIGGLIVVLIGLPGPTDRITVATQGSPVAGEDFRFLLTVRFIHPPQSGNLYLSLGGLNGSFEASASEAQDHPGGRANVWDLTGVDLSAYGRTFLLDATPIWAAEVPLRAAVWSAPSGFRQVRFINGDDVDPSTASVWLMTVFSVTTSWPLTATMTADAPLVLSHPANLTATVRLSRPGWIAPPLLYLSVVTKSAYYALDASGVSTNPWNATTLWNITGTDLTRGVAVVLSAKPEMVSKGLGLDVVVWSPRGSLSAVQLDGDGVIGTPTAVRLWVDTTFSFPVTGG